MESTRGHRGNSFTPKPTKSSPYSLPYLLYWHSSRDIKAWSMRSQFCVNKFSTMIFTSELNNLNKLLLLVTLLFFVDVFVAKHGILIATRVITLHTTGLSSLL